MGVTRRQWFFRGIIVVMVLVVVVRQYLKYKVAPDLELAHIELVALDGRPVDPTTDFSGKNILLTVFATWCGPCNAEIAHMEAVRPQLEEAGFVLVHITDEELGKVERFINKNPSGITYLRSLTPVKVLGVHTFPTHFVFNAQGALRFKQTDPLNWKNPNTVKELIESLDN